MWGFFYYLILYYSKLIHFKSLFLSVSVGPMRHEGSTAEVERELWWRVLTGPSREYDVRTSTGG